MARKIEVEIVGDASSLNRALGKAGNSGSQFGRTMGTAVKAGLFVAAGAAVFAGAKMVGLASDAAEVESKFKVVFGSTVPKLTKQINKFADQTGASRFELTAMVADLGALLKPLTGTTAEAGKMSVGVAKLATDLSSFNNVPVEEALLAIRSGLVGEAEPLRRFGVLLNAATVEAEAIRMGLGKSTDEISEQDKVLARYNLIMKQTTLAQGDAERTSGSFANQLKRLKNSVKDAATNIGKAILPMAQKVIGAFNDMIGGLTRFIRRFRKADGLEAKISVVVDTGRAAISRIVDSIQKILFGSNEIKKIKLPLGRVEIQSSWREGLIAQMSAALAGADWTEIGKKVGEGISKTIEFTADWVVSFLRSVEQNIDAIADVGAQIAVAIIGKLTDPAFWKEHPELIVLVATLFPIGRMGAIGGKVARAIIAPIARIVPEGVRLIGLRVQLIFLGVFGKLPGIVQRAVAGMIRALGNLIKFIAGKLRGIFDSLPGWVQRAFKVGAILAMISAVQTLIGWIQTAIDWLSRLDRITPNFGSGAPGFKSGPTDRGGNPRAQNFGRTTTINVGGPVVTGEDLARLVQRAQLRQGFREGLA